MIRRYSPTASSSVPPSTATNIRARKPNAGTQTRGPPWRLEWQETPPPEQTHAENFYYQKQMQTKTPMVLVLQDGEEIHGVIEWYDKYCLKVNRTGAANLLIYKPSIKYMYKESEGRAAEVVGPASLFEIRHA